MTLGLCLLADLAIDVHVECVHLFNWPSNVLLTHLVRAACIFPLALLVLCSSRAGWLSGLRPSCCASAAIVWVARLDSPGGGPAPPRLIRQCKTRAARRVQPWQLILILVPYGVPVDLGRENTRQRKGGGFRSCGCFAHPINGSFFSQSCIDRPTSLRPHGPPSSHARFHML